MHALLLNCVSTFCEKVYTQKTQCASNSHCCILKCDTTKAKHMNMSSARTTSSPGLYSGSHFCQSQQNKWQKMSTWLTTPNSPSPMPNISPTGNNGESSNVEEIRQPYVNKKRCINTISVHFGVSEQLLMQLESHIHPLLILKISYCHNIIVLVLVVTFQTFLPAVTEPCSYTGLH